MMIHQIMRGANKNSRKDNPFTDEDIAMTQGVVSALSVTLFSLQASQLIRFPGGAMTIGEIESILDRAVAVGIEKFIQIAEEHDESRENPDNG